MKTSAETRPKHETLTSVYVHISESQISVDRQVLPSTNRGGGNI